MYMIVSIIVNIDNSIALPSANKKLIAREKKYNDLITLLCLLDVTKLISPNENIAIIKFIIASSFGLKTLRTRK